MTETAVRPYISLKSEQDLTTADDALKEAADLCVISNSILAIVRLEPRLAVSSSS